MHGEWFVIFLWLFNKHSLFSDVKHVLSRLHGFKLLHVNLESKCSFSTIKELVWLGSVLWRAECEMTHTLLLCVMLHASWSGWEKPAFSRLILSLFCLCYVSLLLPTHPSLEPKKAQATQSDKYAIDWKVKQSHYCYYISTISSYTAGGNAL